MPLDAAVCRKVTEKVLILRVLVDKYRRITLDADTLDNSIPATGTIPMDACIHGDPFFI